MRERSKIKTRFCLWESSWWCCEKLNCCATFVCEKEERNFFANVFLNFFKQKKRDKNYYSFLRHFENDYFEDDDDEDHLDEDDEEDYYS